MIAMVITFVSVINEIITPFFPVRGLCVTFVYVCITAHTPWCIYIHRHVDVMVLGFSGPLSIYSLMSACVGIWKIFCGQVSNSIHKFSSQFGVTDNRIEIPIHMYTKLWWHCGLVHAGTRWRNILPGVCRSRLCSSYHVHRWKDSWLDQSILVRQKKNGH